MYQFDLPIEPPCDPLPELIMKDLQKICADIALHGERSDYSDVIDLLYEHLVFNQAIASRGRHED
jgi:hypothetical protein